MPCCYFSAGHVAQCKPHDVCQFEMPEAQLIEIPTGSGRHYCAFHLPLADNQGRPSGKTKWRTGKALETFNHAVHTWIGLGRAPDQAIDLSGVVFPGEIEFTGEHSPDAGQIYFSDTVFAGAARFSRFDFKGNADFRRARFLGPASFNQVMFRGVANFTSAAFSEAPVFQLVQFEENAHFDNTMMTAGAHFHRSRFYRRALFDQYCRASDPTLNHVGNMTFHETRFEGPADFSNRTFIENAHFNATHFAMPPKFHGSTLSRETCFARACFAGRQGPAAADAFRTLRRAMETNHNWTEAGRFLAYELESLRRNPHATAGEQLLAGLRQWISNCGRSLSKSLAGLLATSILFTFLYALWSVPGNAAFPNALDFSVTQYVRPFAVWAAPTGSTDAISISWKLIASLQSLMGFGFIVLFGLALQRRFRV